MKLLDGRDGLEILSGIIVLNPDWSRSRTPKYNRRENAIKRELLYHRLRCRTGNSHCVHKNGDGGDFCTISVRQRMPAPRRSQLHSAARYQGQLLCLVLFS